MTDGGATPEMFTEALEHRYFLASVNAYRVTPFYISPHHIKLTEH